MPAILTENSRLSTRIILNHLHLSDHTVLETTFGLAIFQGFICTQGARYLNAAKLGKVKVFSITNGEGQEDDTWRPVAEADAVYAMITIANGNPREQCHILVNDEGWPILAGINPPEHFPPEVEYVPGNYPLHSCISNQRR